MSNYSISKALDRLLWILCVNILIVQILAYIDYKHTPLFYKRFCIFPKPYLQREKSIIQYYAIIVDEKYLQQVKTMYVIFNTVYSS